MASNDNNSQYVGAYTRAYYDQYNNIISNGEARIPICFCIDTSSSMNFFTSDSEVIRDESSRHIEDGKEVYYAKPKPGGHTSTLIKELKSVFRKMLIRMCRNDIISRSAVICIVQFDQFADCYCEFTDISKLSPDCLNNIETRADRTNIAKGLRMCLNRLDQQMEMIVAAGNDKYKPVLILMSDGSPTDGREAEEAKTTVRQRAEDGKLNVIPIGIGSGFDRNWLRSLSAESRVYNMSAESEFNQVFDEITRRIQRTASVIAVDEDINSLGDVSIDSGLETTRYGQDAMLDDLSDFMASANDYYDVFISKKSEDTAIAKKLCCFLEAHGLRCFESDRNLAAIGDSDYSAIINEALDKSYHLVVICSDPEYFKSRWVKHEWSSFANEKRSGGKKGNIITIKADSIDRQDVPYELRALEMFNLSDYKDKILPYLRSKRN